MELTAINFVAPLCLAVFALFGVWALALNSSFQKSQTAITNNDNALFLVSPT
jgi:hypothetical protein